MVPLTTQSVSLPSLRMQMLEAGPSDGPLVLLLHGFPELSESWREVLPVLGAAGFHAVAPDLRGYGGTDRPKSGYDLDTLAGDIYQLATMHPEVVDRLVVINSPHPSVLVRRMWSPAQFLRSSYMFFFNLPWLPERKYSKDGGAEVPRSIHAALADKSRVSLERLKPYADNFARPGAARAALAYYRTAMRGMMTPWGLWRLLKGYPRIRAPFMLIWGEKDIFLGRELTYDMEPWFEHPPQVRYLPDAGHFVPLEAPEQVAALLKEFLRVEASGVEAR